METLVSAEEPRFSWVIAGQARLDPAIDLQALKDTGSIWGSWTTWREFQTDNVICHNLNRARDLVKAGFHQRCNLYVPESIWASLGHLPEVRAYGGEFNSEVEGGEDLVALHLASSVSDIVLMIGFNFGKRARNSDRLMEHRISNREKLCYQIFASNSSQQWVLLDHYLSLADPFGDLSNLTRDRLSSVLAINEQVDK